LLRVLINFKTLKLLDMKSLQQWLAEYGESHKNETNKAIHWICVPAIFFSIVGFLYSIKLPLAMATIAVNVAMLVTLMVVLYYFSLSKTLWLGMLLFSLFCLWLCYTIERADFMPLWLFCVITFVLAWIGQFYGHKIEGKKPSFLKDLQFLMIGPAWLMSFIYKKLGIGL
jgi:uncharacterized membrane protein YGL010W